MIEKLIEPKKQIEESRKRLSNEALKSMIIPLFIEQLLLMIVGMADTMMVSYAGEATVSGVSLDTMIYTIFILIFSSVGLKSITVCQEGLVPFPILWSLIILGDLSLHIAQNAFRS